MLDELMYVYCGLGDNHDDQQVIAFEILSLVLRCYCSRKRMCQPKNTAHGDAMPCVHHGDYLLLERLAFWLLDPPLPSWGAICGTRLLRALLCTLSTQAGWQQNIASPKPQGLVMSKREAPYPGRPCTVIIRDWSHNHPAEGVLPPPLLGGTR